MSDYNQAADLKGLLERLLDEAEAPPAEASAPPPPSAPTAATPSDGPPPAQPSSGDTPLLGTLLSNPALLSALPALMENLPSLTGGMNRGGSSSTVTRPHSLDRHTALLCAIKPYLSPNRREAAETVIRLCKVWDALEKSGISLTGLLHMTAPVGEQTGEGGDSRVQ